MAHPAGKAVSDRLFLKKLIDGCKDHALAGCLLSYGQNVAEFHRRAATYVDKILKGTKSGDLPVEQPTKFDLVINGKTAAMLGLPTPRELVATADEMIE